MEIKQKWTYNAGEDKNPIIAKFCAMKSDIAATLKTDQQLDLIITSRIDNWEYRFLFEIKESDFYNSMITRKGQILEEELNGTSPDHPGYVRTPADFKAVVIIEPRFKGNPKHWDFIETRKLESFLLSMRVLHSLMAKYRDFAVLQFKTTLNALTSIYEFVQKPLKPLDLSLPIYSNMKGFPSGLSKMLYCGAQGLGKENAVAIADDMQNTLSNIFGDAAMSPAFIASLEKHCPDTKDGQRSAIFMKVWNFINSGQEMKSSKHKIGIEKETKEYVV